MASISNPNGLRVVTGGQAGTMDIQFLLIKCYNSAFTLTETPNDPYEFISNSNDGFSKIVATVQDMAEVYYIGWPEANSGGEDYLTRVVIGINPVTARGLDGTLAYPTATGRWTALEDELNAWSGGSSEAWFAMPGIGWNWTYDN